MSEELVFWEGVGVELNLFENKLINWFPQGIGRRKCGVVLESREHMLLQKWSSYATQGTTWNLLLSDK